MAGKRTNSIDMGVGARIKLARLEAELSQEKLAETLGVTFQQLQKYEKGINPVNKEIGHEKI